MGIQSIRCALPCCIRAEEEQTKCSLNTRIAVVGLGGIALLVGILALSGIPGLSALGTMGGPALTTIGGLILLAGLCLRCVKDGGIKEKPHRDVQDNFSFLEERFDQPSPSSFFQTQEEYNIRANTRRAATSHPYSTSFTYRGSQPSNKQSVLNRGISDPSSFQNLSYDLRSDEDIVAAALSGCKSPEQAKKVLSNASYDAKKSKKVTCALVKQDPTQFAQLSYDDKSDEDIVAAALSGCKSPEQAKKVLSSASYDAKKSKKVTIALEKIDPSLRAF